MIDLKKFQRRFPYYDYIYHKGYLEQLQNTFKMFQCQDNVNELAELKMSPSEKNKQK
jgi:hypothetical protein